MGIAENLYTVQSRIREATLAAKRPENSVRLLAASKRTDANGIVETIALGHTLFGENRAQALRDKYDVVAPQHPEAEWHFIGHLQKNKVKYIVGRASMIHSLDSMDLATALSNRIDQQRASGVELDPLSVLIQIKLGTEDSKTGIEPEAGMQLMSKLMEMPNLRLTGLMNIAPLEGEAEQWFAQMAEVAERAKAEGFPMLEMSMGMSGDMEQAIQYGSTIVRVGSDIYWA
jgi:hypothetical protein